MSIRALSFTLFVSIVLLVGCSGKKPINVKVAPIDLGDKTLERVDEFNKRIEELNKLLLDPDSALWKTIEELNQSIRAFNNTLEGIDLGQPTLTRIDALISKVDPLVRQLEYGIALSPQLQKSTDEAIQAWRDTPDEWKGTGIEIVNQYKQANTAISRAIAADLEKVINDTSAEAQELAAWMGEEVSCRKDDAFRSLDAFVGATIFDASQIELFGIVKVFDTNQPQPKAQDDKPWICHVLPDAVVVTQIGNKIVAQEPLVRIIGFNFQSNELLSNLPKRVTIVLESGERQDITHLLNRVSSYRISLNLSDYNIKNFDRIGKIEFDWPIIGLSAIPLILDNPRPVAKVGENIKVIDEDRDGKEIISLDASESTDDGMIVLYQWRDQNERILSETENATTLLEFEVGVHILELIVTDNKGATNTVRMQVQIANPVDSLPIADAGPDLLNIVDSNRDGIEIVTVDGSGSLDAEGPILSYIWNTDVGQPLGEGMIRDLELLVGSHVIELKVEDVAGQTDVDTLQVIVAPNPNATPVPSISGSTVFTDKKRDGKELVKLDASNSTDPDGQIISYNWYKEGMSLSRAATPQIELEVGTHTIELQVQDNDGAIAALSVIVIVNQPPIANAGPDLTFTDTNNNQQHTFNLNASASSDADGKIAGYKWLIGDTEIASGRNPEVVLRGLGEHKITLIVTDNHGATAKDTLLVRVMAPPPTSVPSPSNSCPAGYEERNNLCCPRNSTADGECMFKDNVPIDGR